MSNTSMLKNKILDQIDLIPSRAQKRTIHRMLDRLGELESYFLNSEDAMPRGEDAAFFRAAIDWKSLPANPIKGKEHLKDLLEKVLLKIEAYEKKLGK